MLHTVYKSHNSFNNYFHKFLAVALAAALFAVPFSTVVSANAITKPNVTYINLGATHGYNLVSFGDFKMNNADTEGYAMIGGTIYSKGGFSFGNNVQGMPELGHIFGGNIVVDNLSAKGKLSLASDAIISEISMAKIISAYKSNTKLPEKVYLNPNMTAIGNFYINDQPFYQINTSKSKSNYQKFFSNLKKDMQSKSVSLSSYAQNHHNGTINGDVFKGTSSDYNVYNISAVELSKIPVIQIEAADNSYQIINVIGDNTGAVKIPSVQWGGGNASNDLSSRILWNLSSATNITNYGNSSIYGSVLAPKATFTASGSGNYIGTLIVNKVDSLKVGFEGHNYPFSGKIPVYCDNNSSVVSSQTSSAASSETSSAASSEVSSAASSEVSSAASSEVSSAASSEVSSAASSEVSSAASSEVSSAASSEVSSAASSEVSSAASSETSSAASSEVSSAASSETSSAVSSEASSAVSSETSSAASSEASSVASSEASSATSSNNSSKNSSNSSNGGGVINNTSSSSSPSSTTVSGVETISDASIPLAAPSAIVSGTQETINESQVPLAAPKTGESNTVPIILSVLAIIALSTIVALRARNTRKEN